MDPNVKGDPVTDSFIVRLYLLATQLKKGNKSNYRIANVKLNEKLENQATVLIIVNEKKLNRRIQRILHRENIHTEEALTGKDAILKIKNDRNIILLNRWGWLIRNVPHNYVVHRVSDERMHNATYHSSFADALARVHEEVLLSKEYDGSLECIVNAINETNRQFEALLSPEFVDRIEEKLGGKHL